MKEKGEKIKMKSKTLWTLAIVLTVSILLTVLQPVYGPTSTTLLTPEELAFAEAVGTGDYAYHVDEKLAYDFGCYVDDQGRELFRLTGSPAEEEAANWIVSEMTRIGLKNAKKEPIPVHGWTFRGASVQVVDPSVGPKWLAGGNPGLPGTVQSPNRDPDGSITREIVYVGLGRKQDYEGKDVRGKLVLVDIDQDEMYWLNFPHMQAELEGAIGLVAHWIVPGYQDQPGSITCQDSECRPTIPAVNICNRDFDTLKALIDAGPVKVKVWCDAELTIPDKGYNVVGYIPGTTHPNELIILCAIYDRYWCNAHHHTSDFSAMMQVAKALVASGYKPDRTIVFIGVPEEYGWTDTINDWAIGSHWAAHYNHTDWAGRARALIEVGGSLEGDYTVSISGDPMTYEWRQSMLPLFNEFFTTNEPWSRYYRPASTRFGGLPSTWMDGFNFQTAGTPYMSCSSRGGTHYGGVYHVNLDVMDWVSAEALAMNAIANGINAIRLDRALLLPYNFANWADLIEGTLDEEAITGAGISMGPINAAIDKFNATANSVWNLITSTKRSRNADLVNALLMQTAKTIFRNLIGVGEWGDTSILKHEQYQIDSLMLSEAIAALKDGDAAAAMEWLRLLNGMFPAVNVDYEVYYHFMIEGTKPGNPNLMWGDQGREAYFTDVWHEYFSLKEKEATGNTNYYKEICSLHMKYKVAVKNLHNSIKTLMKTLLTATCLLLWVQALLKSRCY
jgi:hypothetical protein